MFKLSRLSPLLFVLPGTRYSSLLVASCISALTVNYIYRNNYAALFPRYLFPKSGWSHNCTAFFLEKTTCWVSVCMEGVFCGDGIYDPPPPRILFSYDPRFFSVRIRSRYRTAVRMWVWVGGLHTLCDSLFLVRSLVLQNMITRGFTFLVWFRQVFRSDWYRLLVRMSEVIGFWIPFLNLICVIGTSAIQQLDGK